MVEINFDFFDDFESILKSTKKAAEETMKKTFELSQAKVPVNTGKLKATGRYGVKCSGDSVIGWVAYGNKNITYAQAIESVDKFLRSAMDRANKKFDEKIKVPR